MKTKSIILLTVLSALLIAMTGCISLNPVTGQREFDPVKTEQVKATLEPIISGGIRRAIQHSPNHADQIAGYLHSAANVFCSMDTNGNFSVEYLVTELDKIVAPALGDSYIIDLKNAAIALYRVNYAERFRAELPPDRWPRQVASLFCAAINQGLKDAGR